MNKTGKITPYFDKDNSICVCFSSDKKFVPYVSVAINSLIQNSSSKNNYDIVILEDGISFSNKEKLLLLKQNKNNISIRFFSVNQILDKYRTDIFYTHWHFSLANYYRLFIPEIFCNYKKILYLDSDIVILDDIAKLYETNLENKAFGTMLSIARYYKDPEDKFHGSYFQHIAGFVENQYDCYNTAILLCNIPVMLQDKFTQKCLVNLEKLKKPQNCDQDILNIAYPASTLKILNPIWVYTPIYQWLYNSKEDEYTDEFNKIRTNIVNNPKLIHYLTGNKPWKVSSNYISNNIYFWKYLFETPFFEEVYYSFMNEMQMQIKKLEEYGKGK